MFEVNRILCPTDLSETSVRAFHYATAFARWYEARMTALHVVPPLPVMLGVSGALPPPPASAPEAHRLALDRFVSENVPEDLMPIESVLTGGHPATRIVESAERTRADLLVVGTHGRRGLSRWLLGSVAEEVLRSAPCPVLAVPAHADETPLPVPLLLERLLCAVDFSDASVRALELALSLAQEADARVLLLHVVEALPPPYAPVEPAFTRGLRDLETAAAERLRRAIPEGAGDWCEPEVLVVSGKPWREIVRAAEGHDAGVIVMGVHGHSPLDRLFFGSTANGVVRHSGRPVLVARPPHAPDEPAAG